jgi:hypothetical protein
MFNRKEMTRVTGRISMKEAAGEAWVKGVLAEIG